jgi:DNA-binding CsgD family transcriptional regulator
MNSRQTSGVSTDDSLLAELYMRMEERAGTRYSAGYDAGAASVRYRAWLSARVVDPAQGLVDRWGRVDADGTVYVRTADGERAIGSWAAGSPEEAIAFFRRKFAALESEVGLLEQRTATTDVTPTQAREIAHRLLAAVSDANALGDLDGLRRRLEAVREFASLKPGRSPRRRPLVSGWDSLTPSELKVVAFVEEGMSNPEIAARLMLSRRTVATHISHILKKLNVTTRTDIARESALRAVVPTDSSADTRE